jgi:crotonobetainyl-CoA:carnitine CoA-transferase CaiB-like acyl-CoA transferase
VHLDPIEDIEHPEAGKVSLLRHPVRYSSGRASARRPPPALAEHTEEVLEEVGLEPDRVRRLQANGVVGVGRRASSTAAPERAGDEAE